MDCSMPGFPVHHQLLELAQTHVHQVGDAIQSSHSLSSPSLVVLVDTKVLSCSVLADSLQPFGLQPTRLFCPWDVSGKNIGESWISSSKGSSRPRDRTRVSCISSIVSGFFTRWAIGGSNGYKGSTNLIKRSHIHLRGAFPKQFYFFILEII